MSAATGATVSSTVCVTFPPESFPESLQKATKVFGQFGDIARIDMTLGSTTGRLLVTFFDIRAAAKVLEEFTGTSEMFPPTPHDFRAVSIVASTFAGLPPTFGGFQTFGEIAGVSISGEDMVIEFYDMRAAQQVAMTVPGCRARRPQDQAAQAAQAALGAAAGTPMGLAAATAAATAAAAAQTMHCMQGMSGLNSASLLQSLTESLARMEQEMGNTSGLTKPPGLGGGAATAGACFPWSGAMGGAAAQPAGRQQRGNGAAADISSAGADAKGNANVTGGGPGKPLREKVNSKDLTKFDIVPEKVRSGEDQRTTVMVRNIPKVCTREAFVELLGGLNLSDQYTFFYMPFDKRRNIHCGFAFVNFRMPEDVLTLFEGMKTPAFRSLTSSTTPPAVSYARLQGQEQLMKHFSLSAVMYDSDARKRPIFFAGQEDGSADMVVKDAPPSSGTPDKMPHTPGKVGDCEADAPRYIVSKISGDSKIADSGAKLNAQAAAFLNSTAIGA